LGQVTFALEFGQEPVDALEQFRRVGRTAMQ
jgi:hypothetical protein